jgi:hypothetical protein
VGSAGTGVSSPAAASDGYAMSNNPFVTCELAGVGPDERLPADASPVGRRWGSTTKAGWAARVPISPLLTIFSAFADFFWAHAHVPVDEVEAVQMCRWPQGHPGHVPTSHMHTPDMYTCTVPTSQMRTPA